MWRRGPPCELSSSGAVRFEGGESAADVDVILFATGYQYSLPFLGADSRVAAQDNRYLADTEKSAVQKAWTVLLKTSRGKAHVTLRGCLRMWPCLLSCSYSSRPVFASGKQCLEREALQHDLPTAEAGERLYAQHAGLGSWNASYNYSCDRCSLSHSMAQQDPPEQLYLLTSVC